MVREPPENSEGFAYMIVKKKNCCSKTTEFPSTTSKRRNLAQYRIVWVALDNSHVQSVKTLDENLHDFRGDFTDIGVLWKN
jgi:hypothetical protein